MSNLPDGDEMLAGFGLTVNDLDPGLPLVWVTELAQQQGAEDVFSAAEALLDSAADARVITGIAIDVVDRDGPRGWTVWFYTTDGWRGSPLRLGSPDEYRAWFDAQLGDLLEDADIIG